MPNFRYAKYGADAGATVLDDPNNLTGPNGTQNSLLEETLEGQVPFYIFGDSLFARTNRETTLSQLDVTFNSTLTGGYVTPTPAILTPSGTQVSFYGFQEARLNFTGPVSYVGGVARIALPVGDYSGIIQGAGVIAFYPGASGGQRAMRESGLYTTQGFITWLNNIADRSYLPINLAQGGCTSTRLALLSATVFKSVPAGVLLLESGANTFKNGETLAQIETAYRTIINNAKLAGHTVILCTPTTFSSALAGYVATNQGMMGQAALMTRLANIYNCPLLDLFKICVDPASTDGQPFTNYVSADGIHLQVRFWQDAAQALFNILARFPIKFVGTSKLLSLVDTKYTTAGAANNSNSFNVLRNAQLFGTAGTAGLPDSWGHVLTGAPTVVYTKAASPLNGADGTLVVDYTGASGSNVQITSTTFHTDLTAGKEVNCAIELELPADVANVRLSYGLLLAATGTGEVIRLIGGTETEAQSIKAGTYVLRAPPWVVPAGVTYTTAQFQIQIVATGATLTNNIFRFRQAKVNVQ